MIFNLALISYGMLTNTVHYHCEKTVNLHSGNYYADFEVHAHVDVLNARYRYANSVWRGEQK